MQLEKGLIETGVVSEEVAAGLGEFMGKTHAATHSLKVLDERLSHDPWPLLRPLTYPTTVLYFTSLRCHSFLEGLRGARSAARGRLHEPTVPGHPAGVRVQQVLQRGGDCGRPP